MILNIRVNWQLSRQDTHWLVSHDHVAGSDVVSEDVYLLKDGAAQNGSQRKYTGQLVHAAYIFAIWYWRSILWSIDSCQNKVSPVSHDRIAGSSVELTDFMCFFKFPAVQVTNFRWTAGSIFINYYNKPKKSKLRF